MLLLQVIDLVLIVLPNILDHLLLVCDLRLLLLRVLEQHKALVDFCDQLLLQHPSLLNQLRLLAGKLIV